MSTDLTSLDWHVWALAGAAALIVFLWWRGGREQRARRELERARARVKRAQSRYKKLAGEEAA